MCNAVDQYGNIISSVLQYQTKIADGIDANDYPKMRRPYDRVSLVHSDDDGAVLENGNWGMHLPGFDGISTNARDDRLETSSLWRSMWGKPGGHVVVPVSHGYEFTKRTGERVWSCVQRPDGEPWLVAALGRVQDGKHRTEWHASMVTTDAGPVFKPIHDKAREVVCLRDWKEAETWLQADPDDCRDLIRFATPEILASHRVHDGILRDGFPAGEWSNEWAPARQLGLDGF